jgi:plastocyanin
MNKRLLLPQLNALLIFAALVPVLLTMPTACSTKQATQIKIDIVGDDVEEWRPTSIGVQNGGTVSWLNNGNELHSVISNEHLWSDKQLARGQSFNFTFTKPGTFTYRDQSDTFVGTIIVR